MTGQRVAVVLASVGPGPATDSSLAGFLREVEGRGEVIVVDATGQEFPSRVRVLRRPASRLVPELWGDGLRSSDAELIAFSTTQMVPRPGWLDALLAAIDDRDGLVCGVGGRIEPGEGLSTVDRAVFLRRFLAYGRDLPARPSGENALYLRDALLDVEDLWEDGFWEAEVHRGLESLGGGWAMAAEAVVDYRGSTPFDEIARQRIAHARRFGATRSEGLPGWERLLRSVAAPALPGVLLLRAIRGLRRRGLPAAPWLTCLPAFVMLASLWAWGEAIGTWLGPGTSEYRLSRSLTNGWLD